MALAACALETIDTCSRRETQFCEAQAYDISNLKQLSVLELRADESLHETFVAELGRLPSSLRTASLTSPQVLLEK